MPNSNTKVACLGLGRMGSTLARSIVHAGFPLVVWNRQADKARALVAEGARAAESPREAVGSASVVVSSLADEGAVLDVMSGADGMLAGLAAGAAHVGTTTISPAATARLAAMHREHGSHYVAGPLLGYPAAAAATTIGALRSFVAGPAEIVERCRPVIAAYAWMIVPAGERPEVAASLKLVESFAHAVFLDLCGQALAFAEKSGADRATVEGLLTTMFAHPALQRDVERIAARRFEGEEKSATLAGGLRDVEMILGAAADVGAPLPFASVVREHAVAMMARGRAGDAFSVLTEAARRGSEEGGVGPGV